MLLDIGTKAELHIIKTQGDRVQDLPLQKLEGKGFFTKEIEDALLNKVIDLAVHSLKDLPTEQDPNLALAGVSYREDPSDLLIINKNAYAPEEVMKLKKESKVGTSSIRRKTQLKYFRKDLITFDIRGNVPTRIDKLRKGNFDAILLASAGIKRLALDLSEFEVYAFNPKEFIPAPAQGVIAYQVRREDVEVRRIIKNIHQTEVSSCTNVERTLLKLIDGGCHTPLGAFCEKDGDGNFHAYACYAKTNEQLVFKSLSYSTSHNLANDLFKLLVE